jgi:biopolymer transport protein ExbD
MTRMRDADYVAGSLRLPVPFFDLLMVLLVCFLVFVSPVRPEGAPHRHVDIPVTRGGSAAASQDLLPVVPHRDPGGWTFEIAADGRRLAPDALARQARSSGRKVVVVAPAATSLQDFIDMQAALSAHAIPFGLAVKNKETNP